MRRATLALVLAAVPLAWGGGCGPAGAQDKPATAAPPAPAVAPAPAAATAPVPAPAPAPQHAERATQDPAAADAAAPAGARTKADYDAITRRNPFSAKPVKAEAPPAPAPAPTAPTPERKRKTVVADNLCLSGIFAGREPSKGRVALIEEPGKPARWLRSGDAFLGGTVAAVDFDRLSVTVGTEPKEFRLGQKFADGTKTIEVWEDGTPIAAATPAAASGTGSAAPAAATGGDGKGGQLTTEERTLSKEEQAKLIAQRLKERRAAQAGDKK